MNRKPYLLFLLLSVIFFSACKKASTPVKTTMTLYFNGDSSWTSSNVTTQNDGSGTVYITGNSADGNNSLALDIGDYRAGNATYTIASINTPHGSFASYETVGTAYAAVSGQIVVTDYSTNTIQGSFSFTSAKANISGTFTATTP